LERPYLQQSKKKVSKKKPPAKAKEPIATKAPKPKRLLTYEDGTELGAVDGKTYFKEKGGNWKPEEQARELGITPSTLPQKVDHE